MKRNIIMRPVFDRPEMLALSLDCETAARERVNAYDEYHTIFVVEHGSPDKIYELIESYPYSKSIIKRPFRFGLSVNILEGMKTSFLFADTHIIYIEDDILLHKTYFEYVDNVMQHPDLQDWSVISAYSFNDKGDVHTVRKDRHYAALAPVISKRFYARYIFPCSDARFYDNPANFVLGLNDQYKEHWESRVYRYRDAQHHQQAGLINRLCDVANIEEGLYVVMPEVARMQHIGLYGYNRKKGKDIPGTTFDERVANLSNITRDAKLMYEMAGSKEYNDYRTFSPKLQDWDAPGHIRLAKKHFTS